MIQNCKTMLYLHANDEWTEDRDAAARFPSSAAALTHIHNKRMQDAQIVLFTGKPEYDVVLPISEECREKAA
jgi:hypothetical protein